jgi:hypothetical protein
MLGRSCFEHQRVVLVSWLAVFAVDTPRGRRQARRRWPGIT